MEQNLILTIVLAVLVMGLVVAGLAIGLILTGKQRLRRGCGLTPKKKGKEERENETTCPMCGDSKACERTENEPDDRKTDE